MKDALIVVIVFVIYFSPVLYQLTIVVRENKKGNKVPLQKLKKILRLSLAIFIPCIVLFGVLIKVNFLDYQSPMTYNQISQITFENFKGLEFFKKSLYGNKRFAYIKTTWRHKIEEDSVEVMALFHPSESFVYNNKSNSKFLLTHEIYHFKITELYARIAKKKIKALKNPSRKKIKTIIRKTWSEEREYQKEYDFETFHSYVFGKQKRYEKRIDSLLNLHSEFEKPKVSINE